MFVCREALPPEAMNAAVELHHVLARSLLRKHKGYESATEVGGKYAWGKGVVCRRIGLAWVNMSLARQHITSANDTALWGLSGMLQPVHALH